MRISSRFVKSLLTSAGWWAGVATSIILYLIAAETVSEMTEAEFDYRSRNIQTTIQSRVQAYIDVLRGTSALFDTSDSISRAQFHAYVSKLDLAQSFPGIRNLNFATHVTASEKKTFEAAVQADTGIAPAGHPEFAIHPGDVRPDYHVLTFIEPFDGNRVFLGFNIGSNTLAANALAVSRDSGQMSFSGRLTTIPGPGEHIGVSIRMPLYRRGMSLDATEERRAAYYGTVGARIDIPSLMLGAIDKDALGQMRLRIYDIGDVGNRRASGTTDPDRLLFDSDTEPAEETSEAVFTKRISMTFGPRFWEIEFVTRKAALLNGFNSYVPWLVLIGCLLSSLLLYSIYYFFMATHRRANELANEMTKGLRASEARLAEAQHMAHLGSWILEPGSGRMNWSVETYHIFGLNVSAGPEYANFLYRIHDNDRQRIQRGMENAIATADEFSAEHRIVQRDGTLRWVRTICRAGHDDHTTLLRGTIMDITEHKHMVEELKRSHELLRDLTSYQDRIKEDERKRIAREIHDELGQTLLALRIDVSMLDARTGKSHPRLNTRVREALLHIDATVKTIRTIINNLRPAVLDLGLAAAIEWQVADFGRRTGIACSLTMDHGDFNVDNAIATTLFRILQESLTNVIRHANATRVAIELRRECDRLVMRIEDNGIGMRRKSPRAANAFGLVGIEERVLALDGEFSIDSAPGRGTTLSILIPLPQSEHDESERCDGDQATLFHLD
ncbi:PAS domain S-box protein [Noviherbaspirillum cavernae]|uniref:PAS domain S-box protein n=1 Tax=Noviherbaspirillum cavernae TaxID=2320862 RepID=A0A418X0I7_9BURK|nr:CHASE domain-containing protein [Noviherbaspirillum cavernae]RJG06008.1 PAS domain S-box protein [Noviherbaspirillum cavernae]